MAEDEYISRTRQKMEARALRALGERLTKLSCAQLENIDMPIQLQEAVESARNITSHGAKRRQIQYIGSLMRNVDTEPIQEALDNIRFGDIKKSYIFNKLESWRDRLTQGDTALLEDILKRCPGADRQRLTQLARNARKEAEKGSGVKSSRLLFRYLKQVAG